MIKPETGEVTVLLLSWADGDETALDRLVPLVYRELRRLAAAYLRRERTGHTLQATALVHETYLRLVDQSKVDVRTRAHFFGIAANLMRQILVNHAERHLAAKRGGGANVQLEDALGLAGESQVDFIELDQALDRLSRFDPRLSKIVELRFFAGLTEDEIATFLDISPRTVQREWRTARLLLHKELRSGGMS
jgi:RNA polymerase sigma factor (TIGR02999 family)